MSKVFLSVTDFALPSPLRGSIDVYSGLGGHGDGVEIHLAYHKKQASLFSDYQSEKPLSHTFERGGYSFEINGRLDGFYEKAQKIEEIKSSFNIFELFKRLKNDSLEHPYILQLRTYGYFHYLESKKVPSLNLHLISTRNGDSLDMSVPLDIDQYEEWLGRRFVELVEEAKKAEKRSQRRRKVAKDLGFPFESPRAGQTDLIATIEKHLHSNTPHMIQAPTGLGKTIGVVYPLLKEAFSRGQQLIYTTPKNSQHSVAEDAVSRLQDQGAKVKAMTFTAKSKLCLKNEPLCNPDYCEFARDHYTKLTNNNLKDKLGKKRNLTSKTFKQSGAEYEVCPFELQIDVAKEADAIICDYNYIFAPRSALGRVTGIEMEQVGKPNLAVDEAHNLVSRSLDYYSPELSTLTLERMREDISRLPDKYKTKTLKLLNNCLTVLAEAGPKGSRTPSLITPPVGSFLEQDMELRENLSVYLKSDIEILPQDPVMRLSFYWSEFTEALQFISLGRKEFFTSFYPEPPTIKINCCDASEMLKECYKKYDNVVSFSATLKPFPYYSQLSGLKDFEFKTSEFLSPFPKENRKIVLIPQISSKYSERERNYQKIAETIGRVVTLKRGNYFAFFPSFDFMGKVAKIFRTPAGFETLVQYPQMRRQAVEEILEKLGQKNSAHVVFGVQGGLLSEGMDYPGDMAIGAFIVGPPLPNFNLERERMREYYQENYEQGFEYAYAYPAMAKAVQAAGRVIRSETDRGLIILMDNRFAQPSFYSSMPQDWYDEHPGELVSQSILNDITKFWDSHL